MWTCLEVVLWGHFQSLFVRIAAVQFSSVRIPNTNQQQWYDIQQKPPGLQQICLSQQERPEPAGTPEEVFCHASLNEVKISKDLIPLKSWKSSYAGTLSLSIESYLYSLQTSCVLPQVLPQQNTTWVCITCTTRNFHFICAPYIFCCHFSSWHFILLISPLVT